MAWKEGDNYDTIEIIQQYFERHNTTREERLAFYRFAIDALKADVLERYAVDGVFFVKLEENEDDVPMPIDFFESEGEQIINIKGKLVIIPWVPGKGAVEGLYFPELNMIYIAGGAESLLSDDIRVDVYRLADSFETICANRMCWYKRHDDGTWSMIKPAADYRFALMYELARCAWEKERKGEV